MRFSVAGKWSENKSETGEDAAAPSSSQHSPRFLFPRLSPRTKGKVLRRYQYKENNVEQSKGQVSFTNQIIVFSWLKLQAVRTNCAKPLKNYGKVSQLHRCIASHQKLVLVFRGIYSACVVSFLVHHPQVFIELFLWCASLDGYRDHCGIRANNLDFAHG